MECVKLIIPLRSQRGYRLISGVPSSYRACLIMSRDLRKSASPWWSHAVFFNDDSSLLCKALLIRSSEISKFVSNNEYWYKSYFHRLCGEKVKVRPTF